MTTNIVTTQTILTANAVALNAGKTTYTDNTNAFLLFTGGAKGGAIYGLTALPQGAMAAINKGMVFRSRNGTLLSYARSFAIPAYATDAGTTFPTFGDSGITNSAPLRYGPLEQIWVATFTALAAGVVFDAQYEDC
jgi:hypothetical protein